jgi:ABC-type transporter Mla subunit MlaD
MKKENIVGLIGFICLILFLWAYTAVKRSGVLKRNLTLYSEYDSIFHLKVNNWVIYNGMYVGYVSDQEKNEKTGKIKITMTIVEKISLPQNTEAVITYTSIIGGRQVNLVTTEPCLSNCLKGEEMLRGRVVTIAQSAKDATIKIRAKADSVLNKYSIRGNVDTLLYNTMASMEKLRKNTDYFAKKIPQIGKTAQNSIKTYQQLSTDIKNQSPKYLKMLDSLNAQARNIKKMNLDTKIAAYTDKINEVQTTIEAQNANLDKATAAVSSFDKQVNTFKNSPTAQKLLFQDSTAANLQKTMNSADQTVKDIYQNPEKYRKITGKKKK